MQGEERARESERERERVRGIGIYAKREKTPSAWEERLKRRGTGSLGFFSPSLFINRFVYYYQINHQSKLQKLKYLFIGLIYSLPSN